MKTNITLDEFLNSREKLAIHLVNINEAKMLWCEFRDRRKKWFQQPCSELPHSISNIDWKNLPEDLCFTNNGTFSVKDKLVNMFGYKIYNFRQISLHSSSVKMQQNDNKITLEQFLNNDLKLAINVKTKQQADKLFELFKQIGKTFDKNFYGDDVCFMNDNYFSNTKICNEDKITIFQFEDIEFKESLQNNNSNAKLNDNEMAD